MNSPPQTSPQCRWIALLLNLIMTAGSATSQTPSAVFRTFAEKYCLDCHSGPTAEGSVRLSELSQLAPGQVRRKLWRHVAVNLETRRMPPEDSDQPTDSDRERIARLIRDGLENVDCRGPVDPGRTTVRRLTRLEYRNTVRDLLGVVYRASDDFPGDDVGLGFDNIGDVLSMSPLLMEKYLRAAEEIAELAVGTAPGDFEVRLRGNQLTGGEHSSVVDNGHVIFSNGSIDARWTGLPAGSYRVSVKVIPEQAGPNWVKVGMLSDGELKQEFEVKQNSGDEALLEAQLKWSAGDHTLGIAFINDYYEPDAAREEDRDRNLIVTEVHVQGPYELQRTVSRQLRKIVGNASSDDSLSDVSVRKCLPRLLGKAYRRPATREELKRARDLLDEAASKQKLSREQELKLAITFALTSPHFVFRWEPDGHAAHGIRELNGYEIATRLAYFLWSSMPDDSLFADAKHGRLGNPEQLRLAARRMLRDPKAVSLVTNFAEQWLQLRGLDTISRDRVRYPGFDDELIRSMRQETFLFLAHVIQEDRSVLEILDADYTFVDSRLARMYELPIVPRAGFQRVDLTGTGRAGILTHAAVLTKTSRPTRTSPVMRGKWILETILNDPPPPPAPGVAQLKDSELANADETLREKLERHRADPQCAACHARMDAMGFALEEFDPIGVRRDVDDRGNPIDNLAEFPDGRQVSGAADLRSLLRQEYADQFVRCLTEKLFVYAIGREVTDDDECMLRAIVREVRRRDDRFSAIIEGIVSCDAYRKRRISENEPHVQATPESAGPAAK